MLRDVVRHPSRLDRERIRRGVAKGERVLRRRLSMGVAGASPVRGADDPILFYRPATGHWHVEHAGRWYEPEREQDLAGLLGLLPLRVIDERELASVGSRGGTVRLVSEPDGDTLEFLSAYGELVHRTGGHRPDVPPVAVVWSLGAHDDGWVETLARLRLDGARRCWIDVYLPPGADGDKLLSVQSTQGRRTTVEVHSLPRATPTRLLIYHSSTAARDVELTFHTSAPEPVDEERELGFVLSRLDAQT